MEGLFLDLSPPRIRLIESIAILGLTVKSLRCNRKSAMFMEEKLSGSPEVIFQLPPTSKLISLEEINVNPI